MARMLRSEFALLRGAVAEFRDAAEYLATDSSTTARRARGKLEAKGPDDAAFFANLCSDLQELGSILEDISESSTSEDEAARAAIRDLLIVIQEQYLKDSGDCESEDESGPDAHFVPLQRLLDELDDPKYELTPAERLSWLCSETKLPRTGRKQRRSLLDTIKNCHGLLKPLFKTHATDESPGHDDVSTSIWDTPLFADAEKFHHALSESWDCTCCVQHQDAMFSFHATPASEYCCSTGVMYFPTGENDSAGWKHTWFEYEGQSISPNALKVAEKLLKPTEHDRSLPEHFCAALDCASFEDLIHITSGSNVLRRRTTSRSSETGFSKELPLSSCFELPQNHSVYSLSSKRRMMLALYLAYAYLHLSGGCWWPYTVRTSVRFPDKIDPNAPPSAFFAASLIKGIENRKLESQFEIVEHLNRDMPSLVAFGRLLLELYVGHTVIWDRVQAELTSCTEEHFAAQMIPAIRACLKPSEPRKTEDPYTVRDSELLRNAFIKDVVLPIQYVLQYGHIYQD